MVDLKTAMAAAQTERRKREGRDGGDEKKKRRSGADLGIEPFDPVKYVNKERADTASMWLVITYAVIATCLMRYVLMPSTTLDKTDVLYLLPLSMIILIPQIHRMVMPERFKEHYTKGTWFKSFFLYTFTFLSLSFLLVNPPFGDIVAPNYRVIGEWSWNMKASLRSLMEVEKMDCIAGLCRRVNTLKEELGFFSAWQITLTMKGPTLP